MTKTYKTNCRLCNSPVYYYPAKLLLESITYPEILDSKKRIVDCKCNGEIDNMHNLTYSFPEDFEIVS